MEKRIFIAIGASIAFLWLWAAISPLLFPQVARQRQEQEAARRRAAATATETATATDSAPAPPPLAAPVEAPVVAAPVTPVEASEVSYAEVRTANYIARFSNRGAQLVSFALLHYREKDGTPVDLVRQRAATRTDFPFAVETRDAALTARLNSVLYTVTEFDSRQGTRTVEFRYTGQDGISVTKTFRLGDSYLFEYQCSITPPVPYRIIVGPGIRTVAADQADSQMIITGNGVVRVDGETDVIGRESGDRLQIFERAEFIGIEDNYFLTALRPQRASSSILRRIQLGTGKDIRRDLYAGVTAAPDGVVNGGAFFGPKETKVLDAHGFDSVLQFGWFGIIARFLLKALVLINTTTGNYGWAIVVLTIIIKIILYPLQHKSIVSMKKMQKVAPKMEAIKAKYKKARTDPEQRQKMNVEMMNLYKQEGINPMSGCVPILLQMPILWGFYGLLSQAIELRGAYFMGWIKDLSDKDPYYITPILMTATMFIQTYITPMTGDPMQRRIFLAMPLVFGWIFKEFPSGLVLYWLVQNILTIIQQMIMNKWWKDHPAELQKA
ncbi:MAG TPA: membrane protein insertase YidC [Thermoanaerobaculia bacterium]|nr:membrane protein insertase YidC [Thermoanaerobaculia bacterium]